MIVHLSIDPDVHNWPGLDKTISDVEAVFSDAGISMSEMGTTNRKEAEMDIAPWNRALVKYIGNYYNHGTEPPAPPEPPEIYVRAGEVFDGDPAKPTYWRHSDGDWYAHTAVDVAMPVGVPLLAPFRCEVVATGDNSSRGGYVMVRRLDGRDCYVSFSHLSQVLVGHGMICEAGTQLGTSGDTGWAGNPHVHIEAGSRLWGQDMDPIEVFPEWFNGLPFAPRPGYDGQYWRPWNPRVSLTINGAFAATTWQLSTARLVFAANAEITALWHTGKHTAHGWQRVTDFDMLARGLVTADSDALIFERFQTADTGVYLFQAETPDGYSNPVRVHLGSPVAVS